MEKVERVVVGHIYYVYASIRKMFGMVARHAKHVAYTIIQPFPSRLTFFARVAIPFEVSNSQVGTSQNVLAVLKE